MATFFDGNLFIFDDDDDKRESNKHEINKDKDGKKDKKHILFSSEPVTFSLEFNEESVMRLYLAFNYPMMTLYHSVN